MSRSNSSGLPLLLQTFPVHHSTRTLDDVLDEIWSPWSLDGGAAFEFAVTSSQATAPSSFVVSSPALDRAELICRAYVSPVVCLFGIACNALNLIILTRRNMTGSPYTYLLGLAVTDISVLTLSLMESALSKTLAQSSLARLAYEAFVFSPIANVFSNSSVWITVLLTVERYISVRYPLKAKKLCTRRLARRSIVGTVLLLFLVNIPRFLVYTVTSSADCRDTADTPDSSKTLHDDAATGRHPHPRSDPRFIPSSTPFTPSAIPSPYSCYEKKSSAFESSDFYVAWNWAYISLIHFIPCILVLYLNVSLIAIVYRANRRRMSLRGSPCWAGYSYEAGCYSKEQIRLTVTCISIICLFLVCIVPSAFSNRPVAQALFGQGTSMDEFTRGSFYKLLRVVTNLLVFCNLSMNFVLYCVFNHKFLYTLRRLGNTYVLGALKSDAQSAAGGSAAAAPGTPGGAGGPSSGGGGGCHFRRMSSSVSGGAGGSQSQSGSMTLTCKAAVSTPRKGYGLERVDVRGESEKVFRADGGMDCGAVHDKPTVLDVGRVGAGVEVVVGTLDWKRERGRRWGKAGTGRLFSVPLRQIAGNSGKNGN